MTCEFVKEVSFSQIHVFKYSRRQGTMADAMEGQVPEPVKAERSAVLLAIEQDLEEKYQQILCRFRGQNIWLVIMSGMSGLL